MRRPRFRIASLCWLVAIVAVFLAGIRYGEYRAENRGDRGVHQGVLRVPGLTRQRTIVSRMVLTPSPDYGATSMNSERADVVVVPAASVD